MEVEHARSAEKRHIARIRLERRELDSTYYTLLDDEFHLISKWYHFAILQLVELPTFQADCRWIARALGISRGEAEGAIARLLRMGVLIEQAKGLKKSKAFVSTTDGVPSRAIRNFHAQVLQKAADGLDHQSIEQRNYSSNFLTIDKSKIPMAKEMMKRFRRRFVSDMSADGTRDSVYCLSMQLFELTRELEGK